MRAEACAAWSGNGRYQVRRGGLRTTFAFLLGIERGFLGMGGSLAVLGRSVAAAVRVCRCSRHWRPSACCVTVFGGRDACAGEIVVLDFAVLVMGRVGRRVSPRCFAVRTGEG